MRPFSSDVRTKPAYDFSLIVDEKSAFGRPPRRSTPRNFVRSPHEIRDGDDFSPKLDEKSGRVRSKWPADFSVSFAENQDAGGLPSRATKGPDPF